jgi:3-oxoacyl-[acyl-carrier protein] reductase
MLKNKTVLVTGGNKGIGKAIVLRFAENGAKVIFTYNSDLESAKKTKSEAQQYGTEIDFCKLDLASSENIDQFLEEIETDTRDVNILVNNAGYVNDALFMKADMDNWWGVFNVIFAGAVRITKGLLNNIVRQDYGRIINVASTAGLTGVRGQTNYSSAKAALIMFTRTLGKELAGLGVTVNAIAPGYVDTDMTGIYDPDSKKKFKKSVPMRRFGKPEEIANVALFLASDLSSYITSQVIIADGGMI